MIYLLFVVGLALLLAGGEVLVRGAVGLAVKINVSKLVIGVTIVSLGTSAPELLVSLKAALDGFPAISIGNVVGSNIANLGLVMGAVAIVFPLALDRNAIFLDWPVMMSASMLFYLMAYDGLIQNYEGALLLLLLVLYVVYSVLKSRKQMKKGAEIATGVEDLKPDPEISVWKLLAMVVLGSLGLMFGAQWFLDGAIEIADYFNVSEHVIAVTLVAFGTSVPELATSAIAAFKKQSDISVGNLIGSNSFNILGIIGITTLVKEIPVSLNVLEGDMLWMMGVAALILPFMLVSKKINRLQGAILLAVYVAYIYFVLVSGF